MTTASTLAVLWRHGRRLTLQDEQELKGHLFLRAEARLRRLHEHGRAARRSQERERWCLTADVIVPARPNSVIEF
jgi:hypothetical protein